MKLAKTKTSPWFHLIFIKSPHFKISLNLMIVPHVVISSLQLSHTFAALVMTQCCIMSDFFTLRFLWNHICHLSIGSATGCRQGTAHCLRCWWFGRLVVRSRNHGPAFGLLAMSSSCRCLKTFWAFNFVIITHLSSWKHISVPSKPAGGSSLCERIHFFSWRNMFVFADAGTITNICSASRPLAPTEGEPLKANGCHVTEVNCSASGVGNICWCQRGRWRRAQLFVR